MGSRASLNKVLLIGNLTRDPELRYTPSGAAVCTFGLATNRSYTASDGQKKEEVEFTKIVSWNKLAELCSQLLAKGRKVYVEGRLQTRSWETPDGQNRQITEVVIDDMRILDSKRSFEEATGVEQIPPVDTGASFSANQSAPNADEKPVDKKGSKDNGSKGPVLPETAHDTMKPKQDIAASDKVDLDDLPF